MATSEFPLNRKESHNTVGRKIEVKTILYCQKRNQNPWHEVKKRVLWLAICICFWFHFQYFNFHLTLVLSIFWFRLCSFFRFSLRQIRQFWLRFWFRLWFWCKWKPAFTNIYIVLTGSGSSGSSYILSWGSAITFTATRFTCVTPNKKTIITFLDNQLGKNYPAW